MAARKGNTHGFQKGRSYNPGGRPKNLPDVMRIFQAADEKAARKIVSLIDHKDPYLAKNAAEYVLNRIYGRPRESVEVKAEVAQFVALLPAVIEKAEVWEAKVQKAIGATEH